MAAKKWYEKTKAKNREELQTRAQTRRVETEQSLSNEWENQETKDYWMCELHHQNHGWPARGVAIPPAVYLKMIAAVQGMIDQLGYKEGVDDKKIQMTKTLCISEAKRRYLLDSAAQEEAAKKRERDGVLQSRMAALNSTNPYQALNEACRAPPVQDTSSNKSSSSSVEPPPAAPSTSNWSMPTDFLSMLVVGAGVALTSVLSSGKTTAFILDKVISAMQTPRTTPSASQMSTAEDSHTPSTSPAKKKAKHSIELNPN